jgi:hypothetical protein
MVKAASEKMRGRCHPRHTGISGAMLAKADCPASAKRDDATDKEERK